MPYWFETQKLRVTKVRDKRRKLTDEEKEAIRAFYELGLPIREIARIFAPKTTRRNIQFILFPERLKLQYAYRKERNWDYDREKHKKYVKNYREHLKEIYGGATNKVNHTAQKTISWSRPQMKRATTFGHRPSSTRRSIRVNPA
jgi:hypothetical protein